MPSPLSPSACSENSLRPEWLPCAFVVNPGFLKTRLALLFQLSLTGACGKAAFRSGVVSLETRSVKGGPGAALTVTDICSSPCSSRIIVCWPASLSSLTIVNSSGPILAGSAATSFSPPRDTNLGPSPLTLIDSSAATRRAADRAGSPPTSTRPAPISSSARCRLAVRPRRTSSASSRRRTARADYPP